jgi:hypothetical protein
MATENRIKITTPPVVVRWADITTPNYRYATATDPRGTYSIECLLNPKVPAERDVLAQLRDFWDTEYKERCRVERQKQLKMHDYSWKEDADENGEVTGLYSIRPKNKEQYQGRDGIVKVEIQQFDSAMKRIRVEVGNGSRCRVSFSVGSFYKGGKFGLSLRLRAVQVIELVEWHPYSFEPEEDGYRGEEYVPEERKAQPAHAGADDPWDGNGDPDAGRFSDDAPPPTDDNFAADADDFGF